MLPCPSVELNRSLLAKPEVKRPVGSPRRRCEDNIKMDIQVVECGDMDCVELAEDKESWQARVNVV